MIQRSKASLILLVPAFTLLGCIKVFVPIISDALDVDSILDITSILNLAMFVLWILFIISGLAMVSGLDKCEKFRYFLNSWAQLGFEITLNALALLTVVMFLELYLDLPLWKLSVAGTMLIFIFSLFFTLVLCFLDKKEGAVPDN